MACEEEEEEKKKERDKAMKAYAACAELTPEEMKVRAFVLAVAAGHKCVSEIAEALGWTIAETKKIEMIAGRDFFVLPFGYETNLPPEKREILLYEPDDRPRIQKMLDFEK